MVDTWNVAQLAPLPHPLVISSTGFFQQLFLFLWLAPIQRFASIFPFFLLTAITLASYKRTLIPLAQGEPELNSIYFTPFRCVQKPFILCKTAASSQQPRQALDERRKEKRKNNPLKSKWKGIWGGGGLCRGRVRTISFFCVFFFLGLESKLFGCPTREKKSYEIYKKKVKEK